MRKAVTNAVRRRSSGWDLVDERLRELEQEANWPDTDHQGFITLFAPSLPELDVFDRDMQNKAKNWHMKLNPMKGQQRAALTTILPLGI